MTTSVRHACVGTFSVALALCALLSTPRAVAQESEGKTVATKPAEAEEVQTFFLKSATRTEDLNEISTALRNMIPRARIFATGSENAITLRATAEDMQVAQRLIADLDRSKRVYRVTLTINESDNGRKTGVQHYALVVTGDVKGWIKQGNRVPIVTGSFDKDTSNANTQIQYLDVGINIEAAISGVGLRTKIEQSSVADEKSNVGIQDPIVRQTTLEATSTFTPGKPIAMGSIDIPGTTRHQDIEAVAELVQ